MPPKRKAAARTRQPSTTLATIVFDETLGLPENRLATFKRWKFNKGQCNSKALSEAGFVQTGKDSARCVYCLKDMQWEKEDNPKEEHEKHCPNCPFVKIGQIGKCFTSQPYIIPICDSILCFRLRADDVGAVSASEDGSVPQHSEKYALNLHEQH